MKALKVAQQKADAKAAKAEELRDEVFSLEVEDDRAVKALGREQDTISLSDRRPDGPYYEPPQEGEEGGGPNDFSAESIKADLMDAVADHQAVEEERLVVATMKDGPKKMLKMKALKLAQQKAEAKKKEAADALTELTRQEQHEVAVAKQEEGQDLSRDEVFSQLDEMSHEELQYTRKVAEEEASAHAQVCNPL